MEPFADGCHPQLSTEVFQTPTFDLFSINVESYLKLTVIRWRTAAQKVSRCYLCLREALFLDSTVGAKQAVIAPNLPSPFAS